MEMAVYLKRSERPKPELGSALQKDGSFFDIITQESIPAKLWTSPQYLYLSNDVIELKDYLKLLFTTGKHTHPIHRTPLEGDELRSIVTQITQILQIHENVLKTALEITLTPEETQSIVDDKEHLAIDKSGEFTLKAMNKITYLYNVPNNPQQFSSLIRGELDSAILLLLPYASGNFQECDSHLVHFSQPSCKRDIPAFFKAVDRIPSHLYIAIGADLTVQLPVLLSRENPRKKFPLIAEPSRWVHHIYIYAKMQANYPEKAATYKKLIQKEILKEFSKNLLNTCGFFKEVVEETLTKKRVETFEHLAGIKL